MKDNSEKIKPAQGRRWSAGRITAVCAAVIAVVQACLTIEGMGIEGFVLWVIILFLFYWSLFTFLRWIWQRFKGRN